MIRMTLTAAATAFLLAALPDVAEAQRDARAATLAAAARTTGAGGAAAKDSLTTGVRAVTEESGALTFDRESYAYMADGRRDPFESLMANGELRPLISELRLTAVVYEVGGGAGSVAILRDIGTKEQYRIRTGQQLGRMRVSAIHPKHVVFTIEEFGFSRQETLALGDSNNARTQQ